AAVADQGVEHIGHKNRQKTQSRPQHYSGQGGQIDVQGQTQGNVGGCQGRRCHYRHRRQHSSPPLQPLQCRQDRNQRCRQCAQPQPPGQHSVGQVQVTHNPTSPSPQSGRLAFSPPTTLFPGILCR